MQDRLQIILSEAQFVRNHFLQINAQQERLRIVAPSILVGFIVSIFLPVSFSRRLDGQSDLGITTVDLIGFTLLCLSFVHAILAFVYTNLSGSRKVLTRYLREEIPEHLRIVDERFASENVLLYIRTQKRPKFFEYVWTSCSFGIFVVPVLVAVYGWPWFFPGQVRSYIQVYITVWIIDILLLGTIAWEWLHQDKARITQIGAMFWPLAVTLPMILIAVMFWLVSEGGEYLPTWFSLNGT